MTLVTPAEWRTDTSSSVVRVPWPIVRIGSRFDLMACAASVPRWANRRWFARPHCAATHPDDSIARELHGSDAVFIAADIEEHCAECPHEPGRTSQVVERLGRTGEEIDRAAHSLEMPTQQRDVDTAALA